MIKYKFECLYCGYSWLMSSLFYEEKCRTCNDEHLRKILVESSDIFGYNIKEKVKKKNDGPSYY